MSYLNFNAFPELHEVKNLLREMVNRLFCSTFHQQQIGNIRGNSKYIFFFLSLFYREKCIWSPWFLFMTESFSLDTYNCLRRGLQYYFNIDKYIEYLLSGEKCSSTTLLILHLNGVSMNLNFFFFLLLIFLLINLISFSFLFHFVSEFL